MKLSEYLSENNITRVAFAQRIAVDPSFITRLIDGDRKPSLGTLIAIEDATAGQVTTADWRDRP